MYELTGRVWDRVAPLAHVLDGQQDRFARVGQRLFSRLALAVAAGERGDDGEVAAGSRFFEVESHRQNALHHLLVGGVRSAVAPYATLAHVGEGLSSTGFEPDGRAELGNGGLGFHGGIRGVEPTLLKRQRRVASRSWFLSATRHYILARLGSRNIT